MKNRFKLFGIIAMVAVIGFSMTACGDGANGGSGGGANDITITITGIPADWQGAVITLRVEQGAADIAYGPVTITGTTGVFTGNFAPGTYVLNLRRAGASHRTNSVTVTAGNNQFTFSQFSD